MGCCRRVPGVALGDLEFQPVDCRRELRIRAFQPKRGVAKVGCLRPCSRVSGEDEGLEGAQEGMDMDKYGWCGINPVVQLENGKWARASIANSVGPCQGRRTSGRTRSACRRALLLELAGQSWRSSKMPQAPLRQAAVSCVLEVCEVWGDGVFEGFLSSRLVARTDRGGGRVEPLRAVGELIFFLRPRRASLGGLTLQSIPGMMGFLGFLWFPLGSPWNAKPKGGPV